MDEPVTAERLKAIVAEEIRLSRAHDDAELRGKRQTALDYYLGKMSDIQAEPGRSSAVSRDVADTVGWMLPGIVRVFTASDRMAVAEPVSPEDDAWADQASDGINHCFWKENAGYKVLYSATWDSLVLKNGIVKHWWDDTPKHKVSEHTGLSDDALSMLLSEDGVEVLAHTASEQMEEVADLVAGAPMMVPVAVHDVKIRRLVSSGQIRIECIPPEDFLLDKNADCIENARFVGHMDRVTRSDLVEMGFDADKVSRLEAEPDRTTEDHSRGQQDGRHSPLSEMTLVDLTEAYLRIDIDGDGVAEIVRCYYAGDASGGELLDWEVWEDEFPFSDIPCNPMPHRFDAESVTDETADVQRIKTVLLRQGLDNIYASNIPTRVVKGKVHNPEELYSPSFGGVVFADVNATVEPMAVPFVANHAFDGIAYQDQVIERRTGVSRVSMALDPEALQNQTATASNNTRDAAYSQIELIARNQAELGWKRVFRAILKLMVKHQDKPKTLRLRNKWVEVDPRHWNADMDITINVGLGTGSRDRDMAMLNLVLANQMGLSDRLAAAGIQREALEMLPKVLNTMRKLTESAGIRTPEEFFPEIGPERLPQIMQELSQRAAQPDPKLMLEAKKAEGDMQVKAAEFQFKEQQAQTQQVFDMQRMEMEFTLKREQIALEMDLKREQLSAELALKRELAYADLDVRRELGAMGAQAKVDAAATSGVSVGGEPG